MKRIVRTIIYFILLFAVFSCAKQAPDYCVIPVPEDNPDPELVAVNTENVLLQQVLHGDLCEAVYDDSVKYLFTKTDMLALGDVLAEEMKKMGLVLNPKLFIEQTRKTHGIDITRPCHFSLYESRMMLYLVPNNFKPEPEYEFNINLSDSRFKSIEDVIFDPRVGLMYPAAFLPQVIDYASRYPEIKKVEKLAVMPKVDGEKIKKWSDESTLKASRAEFLKMVFHINNYVLYENRESLAWLVSNCMSVLQAMFVDFHMEQEPIIDSLVLVRTRSGDARPEALFAEKKSDGSLYIREGLLNYIYQNERTKTPRFQNIVRQYIAGCCGHDISYDRMGRFPNVLLEYFNLEERRFIIAKMMNIVFPIYSGAEIDKIMHIIVNNDPGFIDDTSQKDYYGLDELRTGLSIYKMHFRAEKWRVITRDH